MDETIGAIAGVGVSVGLGVVIPMLISAQRKKLSGIETLLLERGAMTLDELASSLGTSVFAKGYLMQALDGMAREGKLTKAAPPAGHPALRIARDTKYDLPVS